MKYFILILLFWGLHGVAQTSSDSLQLKDNAILFKPKKLIIPSTLITFGIVGLESHSLKDLNGEIREEINEHIDEKITIDDFLQYAPFAATFALDWAGIPAKHTLKERILVAATSHVIMSATVISIKKTGRVMRPDGSANNSFPSGHTATAFAGAEMAWQEYKDVSPWYGIGAFTLAAGTGFFRMYNDRHWLTDVAAGAGIGILSTKIAYWTLSLTQEIFFKNKQEFTGIITPFYQENGGGLSMMLQY
ncbi:MAG: phosphatase PAP2 family protein [Flavobacteriaceae bacterium]|nr:phosphatase PAP2 family protein [Flavobacteriaceae bacterium]